MFKIVAGMEIIMISKILVRLTQHLNASASHLQVSQTGALQPPEAAGGCHTCHNKVECCLDSRYHSPGGPRCEDQGPIAPELSPATLSLARQQVVSLPETRPKCLLLALLAHLPQDCDKVCGPPSFRLTHLLVEHSHNFDKFSCASSEVSRQARRSRRCAFQILTSARTASILKRSQQYVVHLGMRYSSPPRRAPALGLGRCRPEIRSPGNQKRRARSSKPLEPRAGSYQLLGFWMSKPNQESHCPFYQPRPFNLCRPSRRRTGALALSERRRADNTASLLQPWNPTRYRCRPIDRRSFTLGWRAPYKPRHVPPHARS